MGKEMIKKTLKLVTIVLASAVLAAAVTSCGESSKDSKKTSSSESTEKSDKKDKDEDDKDKDEKDKDTDEKDKDENEGSDDYVPMKDLYEAMLAADSSFPEMGVLYGSDEIAEASFPQVADFDYDKVEDFFFAFSASGTAEEFSVICLKDEADADKCKKGFAKAVNDRADILEDYAPDQVDMTRNAKIFTEGRYVVLVIGSDQEAVRDAFYEAIGEEA